MKTLLENGVQTSLLIPRGHEGSFQACALKILQFDVYPIYMYLSTQIYIDVLGRYQIVEYMCMYI